MNQRTGEGRIAGMLDSDPKNRELIENLQDLDWVLKELKERENLRIFLQ